MRPRELKTHAYAHALKYKKITLEWWCLTSFQSFNLFHIDDKNKLSSLTRRLYLKGANLAPYSLPPDGIKAGFIPVMNPNHLLSLLQGLFRQSSRAGEKCRCNA